MPARRASASLRQKKLSTPTPNAESVGDTTSVKLSWERSANGGRSNTLEEGLSPKPPGRSSQIVKIEGFLARMLFKEARLALLKTKAANPHNTLRWTLQMVMRAVLIATRKILIRKKVEEAMKELFGTIQSRRTTKQRHEQRVEEAMKNCLVSLQQGEEDQKKTWPMVVRSLINTQNVLSQLREDSVAAASVHLEMDAALDKYATSLDSLYENSFSKLDDSEKLSMQIQDCIAKALEVLHKFETTGATSQPWKAFGEFNPRDESRATDHETPRRIRITRSLAMQSSLGRDHAGSAYEQDVSSASERHQNFNICVRRKVDTGEAGNMGVTSSSATLAYAADGTTASTSGAVNMGLIGGNYVGGGGFWTLLSNLSTGADSPSCATDGICRTKHLCAELDVVCGQAAAQSVRSASPSRGVEVDSTGQAAAQSVRSASPSRGDEVNSNGSSDFEAPTCQLSSSAACHQANVSRKKYSDLAHNTCRAATTAANVPISSEIDEENEHSRKAARGREARLGRPATFNHPPEFNNGESGRSPSEGARPLAQVHGEDVSNSDLALDVHPRDQNPDVSPITECLPCDWSASRDGRARTLSMVGLPSKMLLETVLDVAEMERASSNAKSWGPSPNLPESSSKVHVEPEGPLGSKALVEPENPTGRKSWHRSEVGAAAYTLPVVQTKGFGTLGLLAGLKTTNEDLHLELESNEDGCSRPLSTKTPTWLDTTICRPGRTGEGTTAAAETSPVANAWHPKSPIGARGLLGARPKSTLLKQRKQQRTQRRRSIPLPCESWLGPDRDNAVSAAEGMQTVSSSMTNDYTEFARSLESMLDQLPNMDSARTSAHWQTDGRPTTAVVGNASARPGRRSSVSAVDVAAKTESDGQLDIHRWSAPLLTPRHHSKMPLADEPLTRRDPTFSSVEAILDEQRQQAKEDGPILNLEYVKSNWTKWSEADVAALNSRRDSSLGTNVSAKAELPVQGKMSSGGPACSLCPPCAGLSTPEPNREGPVKQGTCSSGGLAPLQSKKLRASLSPIATQNFPLDLLPSRPGSHRSIPRLNKLAAEAGSPSLCNPSPGKTARATFTVATFPL